MGSSSTKKPYFKLHIPKKQYAKVGVCANTEQDGEQPQAHGGASESKNQSDAWLRSNSCGAEADQLPTRMASDVELLPATTPESGNGLGALVSPAIAAEDEGCATNEMRTAPPFDNNEMLGIAGFAFFTALGFACFYAYSFSTDRMSPVASSASPPQAPGFDPQYHISAPSLHDRDPLERSPPMSPPMVLMRTPPPQPSPPPPTPQTLSPLPIEPVPTPPALDPVPSPPSPPPSEPSRTPNFPMSRLGLTAAANRLLDAFEGNGVLAKVTGCHGHYCDTDDNWEHGHAWLNSMDEWDSLPPPVEKDCGKWCSAFSFLSSDIPFIPFGFQGYQSGLMLVFDAKPELWSEVQCMSTTDRFTTSRVCCECSDHWNCPYWNYQKPRSSYCRTTDHHGCGNDTVCKQLAAGCSANLFDIAGQANGGNGQGIVGRPGGTNWGEQSCSEDDVRDGECNLCKQPLWCDDPGSSTGYKGRINTPEAWLDEFFDRDGGTQFGVRQCVWKPSQKETFVSSVRGRFTRRAQIPLDWDHNHPDHAHTWNEVNMYVAPGDESNDLAQRMWNNLLGIVYLRTAGDADEWTMAKRLAARFKSLGGEVPVFKVNGEIIEKVNWWNPVTRVNLLDPEYDFVQVDLDEEARSDGPQEKDDRLLNSTP